MLKECQFPPIGTYKPKDLCTKLNIRYDAKNARRDIERKLASLSMKKGQHYTYESRKPIGILAHPIGMDKVCAILKANNLGGSHPELFAQFFGLLLFESDYNAAPWNVREAVFKKVTGVEVSKVTLTAWLNDLVDNGFITLGVTSRESKEWWLSSRDVGGKKCYRKLKEEEREFISEWYEYRTNRLAYYQEHPGEVLEGTPFGMAQKDTARHFGYFLFSCRCYLGAAMWNDPQVAEIVDTLREAYSSSL